MSLGAVLRYWVGVGGGTTREEEGMEGNGETGRPRKREERQGALGSREPLWPQEAM